MDARFYGRVLKLLGKSGIPFLVGGGYALHRHTGLERAAYDLDLFVLPSDVERVLRLFGDLGYRTELTFPHWLGKIYKGRAYADVIFSSGNGIATVDESWFEHGVEDVVLGENVKLSPPEEMIWSKAFVMERERFDGADVLYLFLARGAELDWRRIREHFREYPLVLLCHLVLFLFAFPSEAGVVPGWLWDELLNEVEKERRSAKGAERVCRGTILSREQYLDALARGFRDARTTPGGPMRVEDVVTWTRAAIEANQARGGAPRGEGRSAARLRSGAPRG
jgi:hypothetical protein